MNEPKDQATGTPSACHCYVAVLRRAIPVNDYSTDTSTHIIKEGETVRDVMDWAERLCMGCGADIFAMATDNRERAMARSRVRQHRDDFISGLDDRRQDNA